MGHSPVFAPYHNTNTRGAAFGTTFGHQYVERYVEWTASHAEAPTAGSYQLGRTDADLLLANVPTGFSHRWTVQGAQRMNLSDTILEITANVGIHESTPLAELHLGGAAVSGTPGFGSTLRADAQTFTDNVTAASGTANEHAFTSFVKSTLEATNVNVTTGVGATIGIFGLPTSGTNNKMSNSVGLFAGSLGGGYTAEADTAIGGFFLMPGIDDGVGNVDAREGLVVGTIPSGVSLGDQTADLSNAVTVRVDQVTYFSTTNTRTILDSATLKIVGAPVAGANVVLNQARSLQIQAGDVELGPGDLISEGTRSYTPKGVQNLIASNAIVVNDATTVPVAGSGGSVTLTSTPTIAIGSAGQIVWIVGTSSNTVTLQDSNILGGSNLQLSRRQNVTLDSGHAIQLQWSTLVNSWIELSRTNTVGVTEHDYVFAYDVNNQAVSVANTFQDVTFSANGEIDGWTHTPGAAEFTCTQTGTYQITVRGHTEKTSGGVSLSEFIILNNGTEVAGSQGAQENSLNNVPVSFVTQVITDVTSGNDIEVQFTAGTTSTRLVAPAGNATTDISASIEIVRIA